MAMPSTPLAPPPTLFTTRSLRGPVPAEGRPGAWARVARSQNPAAPPFSTPSPTSCLLALQVPSSGKVCSTPVTVPEAGLALELKFKHQKPQPSNPQHVRALVSGSCSKPNPSFLALIRSNLYTDARPSSPPPSQHDHAVRGAGHFPVLPCRKADPIFQRGEEIRVPNLGRVQERSNYNASRKHHEICLDVDYPAYLGDE